MKKFVYTIFSLGLCFVVSTALAQSERSHIVKSKKVSLGQLQTVAVPSAPGHSRRAISDEIEIELFNGKKIKLRNKKTNLRTENSYSWIGSVPGDKDSLAVLVVNNGSITGRIDIKGKTYRISPTGEGEHQLSEIDFSVLPSLEHDMDHINGSELEAEATATEGGPSTSSVESSAQPYNGVAQTINVLALYTNQAAQMYSDIQERVQLSVDYANLAYENSNIPHRVNLVGVLPSNHDESQDWNELLWMEDLYDGRLDQIAELREQYDADVVSLWAYYIQDLCGRASTVHNEGYNAFHILRAACSEYVFAHELGHNQGAYHNPEQDTQLIPFPYAHGYGSPTNQWRTIMAYTNACEGFCPQVPYFSNPDISLDGEVMGNIEESDNARRLTETGEEAANWQGEMRSPSASTIQLTMTDGSTVVDLEELENGFWVGTFTLPVAHYDFYLNIDGVNSGLARNYWSRTANFTRRVVPDYVKPIEFYVYTTNYAINVHYDERYQRLLIDPDTSSLPSLYFRGTPNGFDRSMPMSNRGDDFFSTTVTFTEAGRFKFDVYGNWSTNYGVDSSGNLIQGGGDITVSEPGTYAVYFSISWDGKPLYWMKKIELGNQAPSADAGSDISVGVGETFQLDASASTDADGTIVTYEWNIGLSGVSPTHSFSQAGVYEIILTVTDNDGATSTDTMTVTVSDNSGWQRTVVLIYGKTIEGQDMFIRGGIDHAYAADVLGRNCTSENFACAIPIRHRNLLNATTVGWKTSDDYLDWYGLEPGQSSGEGSALDWTTNAWDLNWGSIRTVSVDGYGETPLNRWGNHYWMFDVDMDCSATAAGWFEFKSYISNGPGWENNVRQPNTPWISGNHFAECGKLNVYRRNESNPVTIESL